MKKLLSLIVMAAVLTVYAHPDFTIKYDRAEPVYKCGETARITITATEDGNLVKTGKIKATVLRDGQNAIVKNIDLAKENPFVIETTSEKPGFIQVMLPTLKGKKISNIARAGAGFDVEKIGMGYGLPADFMEFWQKGCKAMENTPVNLVKNDARSTDKYTFYDVSIKTFDNDTMYGYLTVPTGKGSFPAYILIPGAGPGFVSPDLKIAEAGAISLMMNVTRFDCEPKASIRKKYYYNVYLKDGKYYLKGFNKRETYFFYSTYTAISRVIDHVAAMKEYDKKNMVVRGSSQGGGSALILAALNKNITAAVSQVAALSDHGAFKQQRRSGWPSFSTRTKEMNVTAETVDAVAPYFDAANFSRFIKVPTLMTVGFIDRICHPSCVYAAYNQLKCEKEMINMPLTGHAISNEAKEKCDNWVYNKLGLKK